jgi:hypothetical protein
MLFPLKRPVRRKRNISNMAATVGDVMDDVTCKSSIEKGRVSPDLQKIIFTKTFENHVNS